MASNECIKCGDWVDLSAPGYVPYGTVCKLCEAKETIERQSAEILTLQGQVKELREELEWCRDYMLVVQHAVKFGDTAPGELERNCQAIREYLVKVGWMNKCALETKTEEPPPTIVLSSRMGDALGQALSQEEERGGGERK